MQIYLPFIIKIIISLMRQNRHHRVSSVHGNKQNQQSINNANLNPNVNFPSLRNNKISLKNEYHVNLNQRKKTYLNLCVKKGIGQNQKNSFCLKKPLQTTRNATQNTLASHLSGVYMSSRGEKTNYKSALKQRDAKQKNSILGKHEINARMRAKMVDWLLEICQAYKCKDETFFLALFIMDEYFKCCSRALAISELHIIGVASIFMACKYEQIHALRMKTVVRDITHNKITAKDIISRQADILIALGFTFKRECIYLICEQIIYQYCGVIPQDTVKVLRKYLSYFLKLISFDFNLMRGQDPSIIAKGALLAAIRSLPEQYKNLEMYDSFVSSCGKDYQSSHHFCSQILFLNVSFKSEFGSLQNISKLYPFRTSKNSVSQSLPY